MIRPAELNASDLNFSQVPRLNESPRSSSPGTPVTEYNNKAAHQRPGSVHLEGEDYFLSLQNFAANGGESRSLPGTPRGTVPRNISFSPRIIFHDTWTSMDYDRRGEIATCNRLTPMLAQQIKEELNTFKMVCQRQPQLSISLTHDLGNGSPLRFQSVYPLLLITLDALNEPSKPL